MLVLPQRRVVHVTRKFPIGSLDGNAAWRAKGVAAVAGVIPVSLVHIECWGKDQ